MRGYLLWRGAGILAAQAKAPRDRGGTVAPPNGQAWRLATSWGAEMCGDVCAGVYPGQLGSCAGLVFSCAPRTEGVWRVACGVWRVVACGVRCVV